MRSFFALLANLGRFIAAFPLVIGQTAWSGFVKLGSMLWPNPWAQAGEPFDLAQDILDADDDLFTDADPQYSSGSKIGDFPVGLLCKMYAWDRLDRWMDESVEIDTLPLHVQGWLMSLNEKQLDRLAENLAPSVIERHVLATDYTDRDHGLPAVVDPETVRHLTRRAAQAPRILTPARTAVMEVPKPAPAYAPAPRF